MLGLGLINVNAVIGTFVASKWIDPTIAPNAIDKAFRIYMLPQGMFSVAVATVLFPSLARLATRGDLDGFRDTIALGLRQINFLLLPAAVVSIVLAEPIVRLLYERGAFDPDQTTVVAGALAAFSIGLAFNGMMLMLNRGFFSLQQPWIPTVVALAILVLNVALYVVFYRVGTWGIPLAISLANIAGVAMLLVALRRRIGRIDLTATVALVRASSRSPRRSSRRRATASGGGSTRRSAAPSSVSSSRSARRSSSAAPSTWPRAGCSGCASWRRYSPCETASARPDHAWTKHTSATSRSSPTSTMGSRRWPIASSSSPTRSPTAT